LKNALTPFPGRESMCWQLKFSKQAQKDSLKIVSAGLKPQVEKLLIVLANNPFQSPPTVEKLKGTSTPVYSRRINIQHRLVYEIFEVEKVVKVLRMWTHYGE
jgi:toxin YoeB